YTYAFNWFSVREAVVGIQETWEEMTSCVNTLWDDDPENTPFILFVTSVNKKKTLIDVNVFTLLGHQAEVDDAILVTEASYDMLTTEEETPATVEATPKKRADTEEEEEEEEKEEEE